MLYIGLFVLYTGIAAHPLVNWLITCVWNLAMMDHDFISKASWSYSIYRLNINSVHYVIILVQKSLIIKR